LSELSVGRGSASVVVSEMLRTDAISKQVYFTTLQSWDEEQMEKNER